MKWGHKMSFIDHLYSSRVSQPASIWLTDWVDGELITINSRHTVIMYDVTLRFKNGGLCAVTLIQPSISQCFHAQQPYYFIKAHFIWIDEAAAAVCCLDRLYSMQAD